jgi:hypothetical protein
LFSVELFVGKPCAKCKGEDDEERSRGDSSINRFNCVCFSIILLIVALVGDTSDWALLALSWVIAYFFVNKLYFCV